MAGEIIQTQVCTYLEATWIASRQEWRLQVPEGEREKGTEASEEQSKLGAGRNRRPISLGKKSQTPPGMKEVI